MSIASNWQHICDQIAISEKIRASSTSESIQTILHSRITTSNSVLTDRVVSTIAVSKRQVVDSIEQAYLAGARNFGESFIQEAIPKIEALSHLKFIQWHFIGPIQSNKTRLIAEHFNWVHSVSREKIASRLSDQRPPQTKPLNILIQVNISKENSKSGVSVEQMLPLAKHIAVMPMLKLRGIMCIPQKSEDVTKRANSFNSMHKLFKTLKHYFRNNPQVDIDTLSMGMSNDFQEAIVAGSNMVRIGTALFGSRD